MKEDNLEERKNEQSDNVGESEEDEYCGSEEGEDEKEEEDGR